MMSCTISSRDLVQNKENIAMLLMDLRKAFDTVSHNILLQKLYHYGIRGPAHKLIESYLTSRKQFVSIDNVNSSAQSINIISLVPYSSSFTSMISLMQSLPNLDSSQTTPV